MTFREYTGKNVEEAIRAAMREFQADLADLDIEILSQGSRGILGVGGEEARILAAPKSAVAAADSLRAPEPAPPAGAAAPEAGAAGSAEDEEDLAADQAEVLARAAARGGNGRDRGGRPGGRGGRTGPGVTAPEAPQRTERRTFGDRPPRAPRPRREGREPREGREFREPREAREPREPREPAVFIPGLPLEELSEKDRAALEHGRDVLQELLRLMGLEATVEIGVGAETAKLNVSGADLGVLIGRRGDTLAALQHLVNLIVAKKQGEWRRISVDVENYRGRREQQLRDVATRAAQRVEQTGKIMQLEPMPALERRIVHVALTENPRVRTQSVGVEPNRRIVILPAEQTAS